MNNVIKYCGCGDELKNEEDLKTGMCWICRSLEPEQDMNTNLK